MIGRSCSRAARHVEEVWTMTPHREHPLQHLGGFLIVVLLLMWPAFWTGAPLASLDTEGYYEGGGTAWAFVADKLGHAQERPDAAPASGGDDPPSGDAPTTLDRAVSNIRSVPYSAYVNPLVRIAGPYGAVVGSVSGTALLVWLALSPMRLVRRVTAAALLAVLTTVAFFATQISPDIFAAWIILIPIVVVSRQPYVGPWLSLLLGVMAFVAIVFHYSHIPLAAAMGGGLGLWLAMRRNWASAVLVQAPLILAMLVNVGISAALPGKISLAPGRLPILLARSLEDGVAVRYLNETCDTAGFAICEVYDTFPTTVRETLWQDDGIRDRATAEQMGRIADEELRLLLAVLRYDPMAQIQALLGNAADQFTRIGLYEAFAAGYEIAGPRQIVLTTLRPLRNETDFITATERISLTLSFCALVAVFWAAPGARAGILLVLLGLVTNALVCGGLSSPADRYQGRIAWLIMLVLLMNLPKGKLHPPWPGLRR